MTAGAELRVLVVSPVGRDAELIGTALAQSGVESQLFPDVPSASEEFRRTTAGALLVAEEALGTKAVAILGAALAEQPAWSDMPVLVLTRGGKQKFNTQQLESPAPLGKVTLLERPMHITTLVSSVKAALRARSRQYERRLAEEALRKSDKLAAVGRLAASIAHEINNPLEAILNALYLLSLTSLDESQQHYLKLAREELLRVADIAAGTLTFNRPSTARVQASVPAILDSVLRLFDARLTSSKIAVERRYESTAPVLCYPGELRQVFANLIGNAFDATRNGGRLILRVRNAVHPTTGQPGVRVTVADTGSGISADVKARVFEAFTSTKGLQGSGLGLWVSKGIIEKHGGGIHFRSSTTKGSSGTVFSVFIPLHPRAGVEKSQRPLLGATGTE